MKKLLIVFILIPISALAQFRQGTITFNDNSTKKGLIHISSNSTSKMCASPTGSNLKFKLEEDGKTEKINIDTIKSFEFLNNLNDTIRYVTINIASYTIFKPKELTINKQKTWVRIVKEGAITVYALDLKDYSGHLMMNFLLDEYVVKNYYCIKKQNQDYAIAFFDFFYGQDDSLYLTNSGFKGFKKEMEKLFGEDCPSLANLIEKENFHKNGIGRIVELYEQNCP